MSDFKRMARRARAAATDDPPDDAPPPPPDVGDAGGGDEDEEEVCPHCGQRVPKKNPHRMDKAKVRVLRDIARLNDAGHPWVKCEEGYDLVVDGEHHRTEYRARAHASRLRWFGLVDKKEEREALYRVNAAGRDFLEGTRSVPAIIWCRRGVVEVESEAEVFIDQIRGVELDKGYWDTYPDRQRRRPDGDSTDDATGEDV